jgi:hypothetical protein
METVFEQYFLMVGELCEHARLARLPVEITLQSGRAIRGIPDPEQIADEDPDMLDHTGFADRLHVGGVTVKLHDVAAVCVRRPR